jgi:hypothetical protein
MRLDFDDQGNNKNLRYEVRTDYDPYTVVGWSDDLGVAKNMKEAIRKHPEVKRAWIVDRQTGAELFI